MANQLFEFTSPSVGKIIVEGNGKDKDLYMSGLFIQGDIRNQNQRVYPEGEIRKAVGQVLERIRSGQSVLGELDHPAELSINLDRVSHVITEMWMDGVNGHGKLKILPTPLGEIAKSMLTAGVKLGVSSRGSGNVGSNGRVSDFHIATVDIVAEPSAPNAYPKAIYESLYNMQGGTQIHRLAEEAPHSARAKECLDRDIIKFINDLRI